MGLFTHPLRAHERIAELADERIEACFKAAGSAHKDAARALIGLVGELDRRGIARASQRSLPEYAAVHGGLSQNQVKLALRLDRRTRDLPLLRALFQHGRVPLGRLRVVIGKATPARDATLADLVMRLSKAELEAYARELEASDSRAPRPGTPDSTGSASTSPGPASPEPASEPVSEPAPAEAAHPIVPPDGAPAGGPASPAASTPATTRVTLSIPIVLHERLRHEQARLAGQRGRPVSMDELLVHLLDGDDRSRSRYIPVLEVSRDGEELALVTAAGKVPLEPADVAGLAPTGLPIDLEVERERLKAVLDARPSPSRARPAAVDRFILARSGGTCEFDACHSPGSGTHHWVPFAEAGTHDPDNLSLLCKEHMALADRGVIERVAGRMRMVPAPARRPVLSAQRRFEAERARAVDRKIRAAEATAVATP